MQYLTAAQYGEALFMDRKSRFYGRIWPVETEEEARAILESIRKEYWDASHHVFAWRIGFSPESERFSDDGEPGGTSGLPTLNVLKGADVHNVLAVTTRYFGGTLLGTGGLVRAYTQAAALALAEAETALREVVRPYTLALEYTALGRLQYVLSREDFPVADTVFSDRVELTLYVPLSREARFLKLIEEESDGRLVPVPGEASWGARIGEAYRLFPESRVELPKNT